MKKNTGTLAVLDRRRDRGLRRASSRVNFILGAVPARVDLTEGKLYTLSAGTRASCSPSSRRRCRSASTTRRATTTCRCGCRPSPAGSRTCSRVPRGVERQGRHREAQPAAGLRRRGFRHARRRRGAELPIGREVLPRAGGEPCSTRRRRSRCSRPSASGCSNTTSRARSRGSTTPKKPVVGVMSALPVFGTPGNPMMAASSGAEPWVFVHELKRDFDVKRGRAGRRQDRRRHQGAAGDPSARASASRRSTRSTSSCCAAAS